MQDEATEGRFDPATDESIDDTIEGDLEPIPAGPLVRPLMFWCKLLDGRLLFILIDLEIVFGAVRLDLFDCATFKLVFGGSRDMGLLLALLDIVAALVLAADARVDFVVVGLLLFFVAPVGAIEFDLVAVATVELVCLELGIELLPTVCDTPFDRLAANREPALGGAGVLKALSLLTGLLATVVLVVVLVVVL